MALYARSHSKSRTVRRLVLLVSCRTRNQSQDRLDNDEMKFLKMMMELTRIVPRLLPEESLSGSFLKLRLAFLKLISPVCSSDSDWFDL